MGHPGVRESSQPLPAALHCEKCEGGGGSRSVEGRGVGIITLGWGSSQPPPKPADDDDYDQGEDWLEKEGTTRTHAEANFLQLRLGAQIVTRFQPFRHTVIIAGRPMQAVMCFLWLFHID